MMTSSDIYSSAYAAIMLAAHPDCLEECSTPSGVPENQEERQLQNFCNVLRHLANLTGQFNNSTPDPRLHGQVAILLRSELLGEFGKAVSLVCNSLQSAIEASRTARAVPFHELLTEPLSKKELAVLFVCHRNSVDTAVFSWYWHRQEGQKYRMLVKDMPFTYFLRVKAVSILQLKEEP